GRRRASRPAGTVTRRAGGFECPKAFGDVFRAVIGIMDAGESTPADGDVLDVVRTGWVEHPGYFAPAQLRQLTFELEQDHATSPADAVDTENGKDQGEHDQGGTDGPERRSPRHCPQYTRASCAGA